jgi:Ca2+-binding RTX toxin-like protein
VINLNAAEVPNDPDLMFAQEAVSGLLIESHGGNDGVFAHGHGSTPYEGELLFFAGAGNDRFAPGANGTLGQAFVAGSGHDVFDISWLPRSHSFIDLRQQGALYGPGDWFSSVTDIEEVIGHVGSDDIRGSDGDEVIAVLGGRDMVNRRGGDDVISSEGRAKIDAGPGFDRCMVFPEAIEVMRCEEVVYAVV